MAADVVFREIISNVFACSTYTEITINTRTIVLHIIQNRTMSSTCRFEFI